ncbi:MAG TPA: hypothetical protein VL443_08290 [Cyclobacteriaceae bacterium]|jgi:hypothetical protein|nr:hypothetical protein [Cyclobacteriaceae bacterium]
MTVEYITNSYSWTIIYKNGNFFNEYDCAGKRKFSDIDIKDVKHLRLDPMEIGLQTHFVNIPEGAEPIFFRRTQIAFAPEKVENLLTAHCIGWKKENTAVYLFVFSDGSTILSDDLQTV